MHPQSCHVNLGSNISTLLLKWWLSALVCLVVEVALAPNTPGSLPGVPHVPDSSLQIRKKWRASLLIHGQLLIHFDLTCFADMLLYSQNPFF